MSFTNEHRIMAYLEGRLSIEGKVTFEKEYAEVADFRKEVDDYRFIWKQTEMLKQQKQYNTQANWEQLSERIHRGSFWIRMWNVSRTVAAILLLPLLMATVYLWFVPEKPSAQLLANEEVRVTSAYGLVSQIVLPDSTLVWLNSGSTLTYPRYFDGEARRVSLSGEAYFKVKSDAQHRFEVEIPQMMTISAYGTEFNVSAYENDPTVEAVLTEGHVELVAGNGPLTDLKPGQLATIDRIGDGKLLVSQIDIEEKVGWKDGKIIFRRAGMEEIARRLARHFSVQFEIRGNRLCEYEYSATFTTESLDEILSLLGKASPMNIRIIEPKKQPDHSYLPRKVVLSIGK